MGVCVLWLSAVALLCPAITLANRVTGSVGENMVLLCGNQPSKESSILCWGRGSCSTFGCNFPVVRVDANKAVWKKSDRYELKTSPEHGDASLQITDVSVDDSGTYCCRVKTLDLDMKREIEVEIQHPLLPNNLVRGAVENVLTLPCKYSAKDGKKSMCWGRGNCGLSGCPDEILKTDGDKVIWSRSERYQLRGDLSTGDMSLTINGVFKKDEGTYCCRVRVPGIFNDMKTDVKLEVEDVNLIRGSLHSKLTLPCSYSTDDGKFPMCWGRGHCGILMCRNEILSTDGEDVTWRDSERFQLKENIEKGNVALTINNANADDGGVYCCRVKVSGMFNDIKKEIRLQIEHMDHLKVFAGETVKLPCLYNTTEGTSRMCWGRGHCPAFKCRDAIAKTDGDAVDWVESERYEMKGRLPDGDVSLTIRGVTMEDAGDYCCRVETPGLFNDRTKEINMEVQEALFGKGSQTKL